LTPPARASPKTNSADPALNDVPVIFLTVTVFKREAAEGVFTGGYLFLPKPVSLKNLVESMEIALATRAHAHEQAGVKEMGAKPGKTDRAVPALLRQLGRRS
jgi:CheY-like chemotaxis protein